MTQQQSTPKRVLILGGTGRIGRSVAQDLVRHLSSDEMELVITGCRSRDRTQMEAQAEWAWLTTQVHVMALDLDDRETLGGAIASSNLVIHCAGPFMQRDGRVLQLCIDQGVNYLDVSDCVPFTRRALEWRSAAEAAGVTAILNSGVFPGISNSMARQGVEMLDEVETVRLYYGVAGSGGAGVTVMRTTFLGLLEPVHAWLNGQWQTLKPYSDRQTVKFPPPYGKVGVYWYEVPETFTLPDSFSVKSVMTKFGSLPDLYNHMTWIVAHLFPKTWLRSPKNMEALAQVSYRMTEVSDRFSGTGIAIRVEVEGVKEGQPQQMELTMTQPDTAIAAGYGTGAIAQLMLARKLDQPGVWPVERVLPTDLFLQAMGDRGVEIQVKNQS
ncbi:MAG: saccharopine dehydrogenase NADP-binding domain-containing protein [Elainellaceae cyanobacterium]